jgi:hypothetical protein
MGFCLWERTIALARKKLGCLWINVDRVLDLMAPLGLRGKNKIADSSWAASLVVHEWSV